MIFHNLLGNQLFAQCHNMCLCLYLRCMLLCLVSVFICVSDRKCTSFLKTLSKCYPWWVVRDKTWPLVFDVSVKALKTSPQPSHYFLSSALNIIIGWFMMFRQKPDLILTNPHTCVSTRFCFYVISFVLIIQENTNRGKYNRQIIMHG